MWEVTKVVCYWDFSFFLANVMQWITIICDSLPFSRQSLMKLIRFMVLVYWQIMNWVIDVMVIGTASEGVHTAGISEWLRPDPGL